MFGSGGKKKVMLDNLRASQVSGGMPIHELASEGKLPSIHSPSQVGGARPSTTTAGNSSTTGKVVVKKSVKCSLTMDKVNKILSQDDRVSRAIQKMALAASKFNAQRDGVFLNAFKTCALNYSEFRMMLKRTLSLDFEDDEFQEICSIFDANSDESIDGEEFLVSFTLLSSAWKDRQTRRFKSMDQKAIDEASEKEEREKALKEEAVENAAEFDFSEEEKMSAIAKIKDAAKKYIPNHPSAVSLDGFEVKFLKPGEFRELLKRTFSLVVDKKELGALIRYFNHDPNNHLLECGTFLIKFGRLGIDQRDEARLKQLELTRTAEQEAQRHHEEKIAEQFKKMEMKIDCTYNEEDSASAFEKLNLAAIKFQKNHPSSMGLDGFNGRYLAAGAFREMLKRTFNLIVTNRELAALLDYFDEDKNGQISCKAFLVYFSKVGFAGKSKRFSDDLARQRLDTLRQEEEHQAKMAAQWKKLELAPDQLASFTDEDTASVMKKLGLAAMQVDTGSALGSSLSGFEGRSLQASVFRELCRRTLFVKFTDNEFAAALAAFELEGSSKTQVDCVKFMMKLKSLAFEESERMRVEQLEKKFKALRVIEEEKEVLRRIAERGNATNTVDFDFTPADVESAAEKLRHAVAVFDKAKAPNLDALATLTMQPGLFRSTISKCYRLNLTPKETGALATPYLNAAGDVKIPEFTAKFYEMNRDYREETRKRDLKKKNDIELKKTHYLKQKESELAKEQNDKLKHEKEDQQSLLKKVKEAARLFAVDNASYIQDLQTFKGPALSAAAFKANFFRIFLIKLSFSEIGALMSFLNPLLAADHLIEGANFLKVFFKLARLEEDVLLGTMIEDDIGWEALILDPHPADALSPSKSKSASVLLNNRSSGFMTGSFVLSSLTAAATSAEAAATADSMALGTDDDSSNNSPGSGQPRKKYSMLASVLTDSINPWTEGGLRESAFLGELNGRKSMRQSKSQSRMFGSMVGKVRVAAQQQSPGGSSDPAAVVSFAESLGIGDASDGREMHVDRHVVVDPMKAAEGQGPGLSIESDVEAAPAPASLDLPVEALSRLSIASAQQLMRLSLPRTFSRIGLARQQR